METKSKINKETKKILFYTSIPRSFRSSLIGNLYELAQIYPIILLAEKLDDETMQILHNKKLFPKLEAIEPVHQYTGQKRNIFSKNIYLYKLAKQLIHKYKPDIVITANDTYPFEMYLLRFSKRIESINICMQAALEIPERMKEDFSSWIILVSGYDKFPKFFPPSIIRLVVKIKRYIGHLIFYWIMPIMVKEYPFLGKKSFILLSYGTRRLKDSDYCVVFSYREYQSYVTSGLPEKKILILSHPLVRVPELFTMITYDSSMSKSKKQNQKTLTIMLPSENISFKKADHSIIDEIETLKNRRNVVILITEILKGWKVFIKPHPGSSNIEKIRKNYEIISPLIKVADPRDAAEKYIQESDVIVGVPPPSASIFISSLLSSNKVVLSIDLAEELTGDYFKGFNGVEYIDNEEELVNILNLISKSEYQFRTSLGLINKGFSSSVELIEHIFANER